VESLLQSLERERAEANRRVRAELERVETARLRERLLALAAQAVTA
jgi:ribosome-binding protein aMBF1 (putative translation factor)